MAQKFKGDLEANFKASEEPNTTGETLYDVTFRQNRSFELHVGAEVLRFESGIINPVWPLEYKTGVPARIVNSADFQTQGHFFNVSERK